MTTATLLIPASATRFRGWLQRRRGLGELMQRLASSSTFGGKADDPGGTGRWLLERDGGGLG